MHSITMNDRCLVGWMVTDDTILGTLFMAVHMMEVLKELSPAAIGMFSLGGGRHALLAQWRYLLPHPLWEEP